MLNKASSLPVPLLITEFMGAENTIVSVLVPELIKSNSLTN